MRKKPDEDRPDYQRRAFSGWLEHRYGTKRPVYVPGKSRPRSILNKEKLNHVIEETATILAGGSPTKFEYEGACRAGLRASLCLQGYDWSASDSAAGQVVSAALDKIHATRPSWDQGQREYTDPLECCSWCKGPIPDDLFYRPTPARYCSDICAKSALQQRDFELRSSRDRAYRAAAEVIRAHKLPLRSCACCHKKFRTREKTQAYCSEACANQHRPVVQVYHQQCQCCGTAFTSTYSDARFCSPTCRAKIAMLNSGAWKPKKLTPPVFDFYLTNPINASRPAWLTPERFDEMVAA